MTVTSVLIARTEAQLVDNLAAAHLILSSATQIPP